MSNVWQQQKYQQLPSKSEDCSEVSARSSPTATNAKSQGNGLVDWILRFKDLWSSVAKRKDQHDSSEATRYGDCDIYYSEFIVPRTDRIINRDKAPEILPDKGQKPNHISKSAKTDHCDDYEELEQEEEFLDATFVWRNKFQPIVEYDKSACDVCYSRRKEEDVGQDADDAMKVTTIMPHDTPRLMGNDALMSHCIGQAFQVAYMEFLKASGIPELDYQKVLNQQEILHNEELTVLSNSEMEKEIILAKGDNEALGVVVVESGWGSMLPTAVLAHMAPFGAASRSGVLRIGDLILAVNGVNLVGLSLEACQMVIKAAKHRNFVKLRIVSCPPVLDIQIKRPEVQYQLGLSVQDGVIYSLLRGGMAERCGVRVGHRIISVNRVSVVATPHDHIVKIISDATGEIRLQTMLATIFRLLTGEETPQYI